MAYARPDSFALRGALPDAGAGRAVGTDCAPAIPRAFLRGASLAIRFLVAALAFTFASPLWAAMYKWVDDKGVVHYSDQMPPEAVNKGSVQLSPQGVPIKTTEPAPTPESLKARGTEQERDRELARQQLEVARRDRALLNSYSSEAEIDLARSRALQTVEEALQSALAFTAELSKRRAALFERKGAEPNSTRPPDHDQELVSIQNELAHQAEVVAQKRRQIAEIKARYDADKTRWRELAASKGGPGATSSSKPAASTEATSGSAPVAPAGARPSAPK